MSLRSRGPGRKPDAGRAFGDDAALRRARFVIAASALARSTTRGLIETYSLHRPFARASDQCPRPHEEDLAATMMFGLPQPSRHCRHNVNPSGSIGDWRDLGAFLAARNVREASLRCGSTAISWM